MSSGTVAPVQIAKIVREKLDVSNVSAISALLVAQRIAGVVTT